MTRLLVGTRLLAPDLARPNPAAAALLARDGVGLPGEGNDAEGGDSGVPRGEGGSLSARAGTSKPRCHPLSLSDARDRPSSRRLNWCHSSI